jgi:hypothetical protein
MWSKWIVETNQTKEPNMTKLINAYRALPTPTNRNKLQTYLNKHMMAVCLATADEVAFLRANEFSI